MTPDALSIGFATFIASIVLFMLSITLFINYKTSANAVHKKYAKWSVVGGIIAFLISVGFFRMGLHC